MKRIPWDIYEAALLVEAYWLIEDYPTQKKKILQGLSNLLRRRAIRKGMEIEPKFRNLAGMNFQYSLLQYYITDGEEGLSSHVAQTIAEVSDIYQNQHDKYLEILNHAFQETGNIDSRRGDDMGKFSQLKQRILSFFLYAPDTTLTTEKIGGGKRIVSPTTNENPSHGTNAPVEGFLSCPQEKETPKKTVTKEQKKPPYPVEDRPWDRYEVALLIGAYEQIKELPDKKDFLLTQLIGLLKKRSMHLGISIDSHFLSVESIQEPYGWIVYLLQGEGRKPDHPLPKVFGELVHLYQIDRSWYELLLRHAKKDAGIVVEEKKQTPIKVVNGVRIDGKTRKPQIEERMLPETEKNKSSLSVGPEKEEPVIQSEDGDKKIKQVEMVEEEASEDWFPCAVYHTEETGKAPEEDRAIASVAEVGCSYGAKKIAKTISLSLKELRDYTSLSPQGFYYGNGRRSVSSWEDLYLRCLRLLAYDHLCEFRTLRAQCRYGGKKYLVAPLYKGELRKPGYVTEGFYAETDLTPNVMMNYLRQIIKQCHIPWENILFEFIEGEGTCQEAMPVGTPPSASSVSMGQSVSESMTHGETKSDIYGNKKYVVTAPSRKDKAVNDSVSNRNREELPEGTVENTSASQEESKEKKWSLNLSQERDYLSLTPIGYSYFGDSYDVNSWEELYAECCQTLLEDYPRVFTNIRWKHLHSLGKLYLASRNDCERLRKRRRIGDGFFLELALSPNEMMQFLRQALVECQVDFENLTITFASPVADTIEKPVVSSSSMGTPPFGKDSDIHEVEVSQVENLGKEESKESVLQEQINQILADRFSDGMRLNGIYAKRFQAAYKEVYGESLPLDKEALLETIKQAGHLRSDGRVYAKEQSGESDVIRAMVQEVQSLLRAGTSAIYWDCLFEKYRRQLADCTIFSTQVMKDELKKPLMEGVPFLRFYRSEMVTLPDDAHRYGQEIQKMVKESLQPLTLEEIHDKLWYWPVEEIKKVLKSVPGMVITGNAYFYIPNLSLTDVERQIIRQMLKEEIAQNGFIPSKKLEQLLQERCPFFSREVVFLSHTALRKVIGYMFSEDVSVNGSILVEKGSTKGINDIFKDFLCHHTELDSSAIKEVAEQIGKRGNYWNDVMTQMVRVGPTTWYRRDRVPFTRPAAIAKELDEYMGKKKVIPLRDVKLFLGFPSLAVPWNSYVLESYLYMAEYTPFRLVQNSSGITESGVYGAIVRRGCDLDDYEDVLIYILAQDSHWQTESEALDRIVIHHLQSTRRVTMLEHIMKQAKALRNEWEEQER